jgi:hypothetical protein
MTMPEETINNTEQSTQADNVGLSAVLASHGGEEKDSISLKWGTLKSWNIHSEKGREILQKWGSLGCSFGAMTQDDTPEQKQLICDLIDTCNAETIYLEWDGKDVSKEEAKQYVMEYRKK